MNIVWFRRDLRIADNPALFCACQEKGPVTAVYFATPETWRAHSMGEPQQEWLHQNIVALEKALNELGIHLIYKCLNTFDDSAAELLKISKALSVKAVYLNHEYEWDESQRDQRVWQKLSANDINLFSFHEQCLIAPSVIKNQKSLPYAVFTPFKKASLFHLQTHPGLLAPLPPPIKNQSLEKCPIKSDPFLIVNGVLKPCVKPGYQAAQKQLTQFVHNKVTHYHERRDMPSLGGTSLISPYLAIGVLSVRQCTSALLDEFNHNLDEALCNKGASTWLSELLWRDFYRMIAFNFPRVCKNRAYKEETEQLRWHDNETHFIAWSQGKTGVPIIDSAMRQLNTTGWMHNRLRMIVAMYFTKNLWLDWRKGEAYFASKLIDWDFSSNNGGWQWCASTGTDSAPYFRIFNPVTQSERFDKEGVFIKHFCPELSHLDNQLIHNPHQKTAYPLDYPKPLVDLKCSRQYAIEQFKALK